MCEIKIRSEVLKNPKTKEKIAVLYDWDSKKTTLCCARLRQELARCGGSIEFVSYYEKLVIDRRVPIDFCPFCGSRFNYRKDAPLEQERTGV